MTLEICEHGQDGSHQMKLEGSWGCTVGMNMLVLGFGLCRESHGNLS